MKNFQTVFLAFLLFLTLSSCERDDICLEDITPYLIIRFYNYENPDQVRTVQDLKVKIEGIEGDYINETITSITDSIAVPLRIDQNRTRMVLTLAGNEVTGTEDNPDTLDLVYNQEDVFISRSCGFKTIYKDVIITYQQDDNNWIKELETESESIEIIDENEAHVKIYH